MGKSSAVKSNKCAVCHHSFGLTRWRHTCSLCKRNVCDDCAPMQACNGSSGESNSVNTDNNTNDNIKSNNSSIASKESVVNSRVCKNCKMYSSNGNNFTDGKIDNQPNTFNEMDINRLEVDRTCTAQRSPQASLPVAAQRANPNDPAERERRAQVAEARLRAEQTRGIATSNEQISTQELNAHISEANHSAQSKSSKTYANNAARIHQNSLVGNNENNFNNDDDNNKRTLAKSEEKINNSKSGEARRVGGTSPPAGSNPVLEAALRRQRQGALPCNNNAATHYSTEKTKLLREIDNLLARHAGTAPFGLRSSDENKLRIYLNYLKEKYNCSA